MTTSKLPFDLSPESISIWLHSLSEKNSVNSAVELNSVAKLLRRNKAEAKKILDCLILLIPSTLHISNTLESLLLADSNTKKPAVKIIRLNIQLLRNISLVFCSICNQSDLSDNEKNLAIYTALQLFGYSQRFSALFHQTPSSTLWKEMGEIYNLAIKNNSTQQEINHKVKSFKNLTTIESALKRNILFNISSPYQYSENDIIELFLISDQLADKLELNPSYSSSINTFHWNPRSKEGPSSINHTQQTKEFYITINSSELVGFMQSNNFNCKLDQDALTSLLDHLSGYQSTINAPIPSAPTISHIITGFNNITEHLIKVNKLKKIQQLSAESPIEQSIESLSLESIPFEKNTLNNNQKNTYLMSNHSLLSETKTVKTLKVNNDKYMIAETSFINCSIGDLCVLCSANLSHTLGIIRQIRVTNTTKTLHILIEKVKGTPSTQLSSSTTQTEEGSQIILTQEANIQKDLFHSPCKLATGTRLTCASGDNFTLDKLIDYTPFFNRYQIML